MVTIRRIPAHFVAIAEALSNDAELRRREALEGSALDRVLEGLRMGALAPSGPEIEAELDRRALGQGELARLGRDRQRAWKRL